MKKAVGLLLLVVVVVVVVVVTRMRSATGGGGSTGGGDPITLTGYVGGEKMNLLKDPEVVALLKDRYGLTLSCDRRGSMEMVEDQDAGGRDFLWPSSQVAMEIYKSAGKPQSGAEIILNSPIILYSWATVTDALVKQGIVQKVADTYYIVDFPRLIALINEGKSWKDLGLPQLYGRVTIYSTDPTRSNSGNMFAGLLANVLNNGQVVDDAALGKLMPTIKRFFDAQGFMDQSSDVIFRQFLNRGMGDKPLVIGYEAQLLEYTIDQPQDLAKRREPVRLLYPKPTVWSSHPVIALTQNARRLIAALQDPDFQRLAWRKHGFRSGSGSDTDVSAFASVGIPPTIDTVVPMPSARSMRRILEALGSR